MRLLRVPFMLTGLLLGLHAHAADQPQLWLREENGRTALRVLGEPGTEWRFQTSSDLVTWTNTAKLGSWYSGGASLNPMWLGSSTGLQFVRAVETDGLFDTNLLRTISLTFTNSNWPFLLSIGRSSGSNVFCTLALDNGITLPGLGARYKGNSSFDMGGLKKSVNLDINWIDPEGRLMGYRTVNLNNAAGDYTMMREPLYFNIMREYTPCPRAGLARLMINGQYWGVYSMVDQLNKDLLDEWFPGNDGDRWRAPNIGSGGFDSGSSAFTYLGPSIERYTNHYELKSEYSEEAWARLVHACYVLNSTPGDELRDRLEEVFAVDRWLWFLALENVFVDDDSYWFKGADYSFYYEPESGRFHPVEHDGNESFFVEMGINYTLSPLSGSNLQTRPLLWRMLGVPELRQRYLAHIRTALEERFNPEYLTPYIDHFHRLSVADIAMDPKKSFTMTGYTNALVNLKRYVTNRYNFLVNHPEIKPKPPRILEVHGPETDLDPGETPVITAWIEQAGEEGIDSVWLYWRDKPYGRFASGQMFDDGTHGDGEADDRVYGAATEPFPAGNKIHFYVEARSANAANTAAFSPPRAEQQTYSYQVALLPASYSPLLINEIMAANSGAVLDPQGEADDWIELRNTTAQEIDLTGLYLTDHPDNPRKWPFPEGSIIPPAGYLLVWADGDMEASGLHANFKLDQEGEQLLLIDTDENLNAVLDAVTFGHQERNFSYGRMASDLNTFQIMPPTPGEANE